MSITTQEKQKYCNILGVSLNATSEEITRAYKKLALKYHPDKNRGNEEWAKGEFIKVSEAYSALTSASSSTFKPRKNYDFSGKSSAEKFKMAFEMMDEMKKDFERMAKDLDDIGEDLNRQQENLREEAIQNTEKKFALNGVSVSDLDPSLWSPYGDWKEKFRNLSGMEFSLFLIKMGGEIERAGIRKRYNNNNYSPNSSQTKDNFGKHWTGSPSNDNFRDGEKNGKDYGAYFDPSDRIKVLEEKIEYCKKCLRETSSEEEKQKCREWISNFEAELELLNKSKNQSNSTQNSKDDNNNDKDQKINQLEEEIEQLKKQKPETPQQQAENQKKIEQKEQELEEVKKDKENNQDNENYDNWTHEQLVAEITKLKAEIAALKSDNNMDNSKKQAQLTKKLEKLEKAKANKKSSSDSNNNKFPTGWVVGGGILVVIGGLVAVMLKKSKKKNK